MVAPELRGRGIGSAAIRVLLAEAVSMGKPLRLYVNAMNRQALALYERLGFRRVDEAREPGNEIEKKVQYFLECSRMLTGLQLPFQFDRNLLKADLALIRPEEWTLTTTSATTGVTGAESRYARLSGRANDLVSHHPGARNSSSIPKF